MRAGRSSQPPAEHAREPGPTLSRRVGAPASAVWEVLADGWLYATWVVGASRIRDVEPGWPQPGAKLHHSVGVWPALINDSTTVERAEPGKDLVLTARGWPAGEAHVHLSVEPLDDERCVVTMTEDAISGAVTLIPGPVRHLLLTPRNEETLLRLALLAEGRHRAGSASG